MLNAGGNPRAENASNRIPSVFASRLNNTVDDCDDGRSSYDPEKCTAQKAALKLFLQREEFQNGLTRKEIQEEGQKVESFYNSLSSSTLWEDHKKIARAIVEEVLK